MSRLIGLSHGRSVDAFNRNDASGGEKTSWTELGLGRPMGITVNHILVTISMNANNQLSDIQPQTDTRNQGHLSLTTSEIGNMLFHIFCGYFCAGDPIRNILNGIQSKIINTCLDQSRCQVDSSLQLHKILLKIDAHDFHNVDGLDINHYRIQKLRLGVIQSRRKRVSIFGMDALQLIAYFSQHHCSTQRNKIRALHVRNSQVLPFIPPSPLFGLRDPNRSHNRKYRTYRLKPLGTCLRGKYFNEGIENDQSCRGSQQKHRDELPPTDKKTIIQRSFHTHTRSPYTKGNRRSVPVIPAAVQPARLARNNISKSTFVTLRPSNEEICLDLATQLDQGAAQEERRETA